jgi:hypothetical protein
LFKLIECPLPTALSEAEVAAKTQASPTPVDAYGDHDMVCPLPTRPPRDCAVTYVRVGQDAGLFPRRTTVRELRRPGETGQK